MPSRPILFPVTCTPCGGTGKAQGQTYTLSGTRYYIPCGTCRGTGLDLWAIRANNQAGVEPEAALRRVRALDTRKGKETA